MINHFDRMKEIEDTVEKIESDKYNLSKTVHIKTYQNFNDVHYVTVLKVK